MAQATVASCDSIPSSPTSIQPDGTAITRHLSVNVLKNPTLLEDLNRLLHTGFDSKTNVDVLLKENRFIYITADTREHYEARIVGYVFVNYAPFEIEGKTKWGLYVGRIQVAYDAHGSKIGRRMSNMIVRDGYEWERVYKHSLFVWFKTFTPLVYLLGHGMLGNTIQPLGTKNGIVFTEEAKTLVAAIAKTLPQFTVDPDYPFIVRDHVAHGVGPSDSELKRVERIMDLLPSHHVFKAAKMDVKRADVVICVGLRLPPLHIASAL